MSAVKTVTPPYNPKVLGVLLSIALTNHSQAYRDAMGVVELTLEKDQLDTEFCNQLHGWLNSGKTTQDIFDKMLVIMMQIKALVYYVEAIATLKSMGASNWTNPRTTLHNLQTLNMLADNRQALLRHIATQVGMEFSNIEDGFGWNLQGDKTTFDETLAKNRTVQPLRMLHDVGQSIELFLMPTEDASEKQAAFKGLQERLDEITAFLGIECFYGEGN